MRFELHRLAADLGGELHGVPPGEPALADGVAVDSRELRPGQLFAAVHGSRDGHDFVADARAAGAAAVLAARVVDAGPTVVVPEVSRALYRVAGLARRRLPEFVVGITGSVGKTTTKDLLAAVLGERFATAASHRSHNNELGVPLTLANAPEGTEATVVEMGARGHGHIALLCSLTHPTVGVVTAVEAVHTELMGAETQIAVAKRELVEHLPPSGLAVLNAADARVAAMASHTRAEVLTFGEGGEVRAVGVTLDADLRPAFRIESPWEPVEVHLGTRGVHNVGNALAAAAVGLWSGVSAESVAAGLGAEIASPWRMALTVTASGARVLNDAYNAGPASVAAALRSLASLPAQRRVAVLGLMAELGDRAEEEHRKVAALAAELGIEVVAVGTDLYGVAPLSDAPAAAAAVLEGAVALADGTAVLVKGSRVAGLEAVAEILTSEIPAAD